MPSLELTTDRLRLSVPDVKHAASVLAFYERNREHLAPTSPVLPPEFYAPEFWRERLAQSALEFADDESVRLFLEEREYPGRFVGTINFTQICRGPFQACYLGYNLDHERQGRGFMSEALARAVRYVFEEKCLHRIMANYLPDNVRSANVLAKMGFHRDGESPAYLFIQGAWRAHVLTSLTNTHWRPRAEDQALFGGPTP